MKKAIGCEKCEYRGWVIDFCPKFQKKPVFFWPKIECRVSEPDFEMYFFDCQFVKSLETGSPSFKISPMANCIG